MPDFKGWKERRVVLCSVVFLEKVACSVVSWLLVLGAGYWESLYSQPPCVMKAELRHIVPASSWTFRSLQISFLILHSFRLLPIDSSLCYLASSSQIQWIYHEITLAFPLKSQLASSLLSFGKHPLRSSPALVVTCVSYSHCSFHWHPVCLYTPHPCCFPNL